MRSQRMVWIAAAALASFVANPQQLTAQKPPVGQQRKLAQQGYVHLKRNSALTVLRNAPLSSARALAPAQVPHLPASANLQALPTTCPPEAVGATCGFVNVPFDREHPWRGKISIYFEVYAHTGAGPAESAIFADPGGGGADSATAARGFFLPLFGPNLDVHDLVLIDGRGRGGSQAIKCEELQHGTAPYAQAQADCAAQLGDAASRYGAGDIAQDMDAVRAALGYDKVDYYGGSYGGVDVEAYATRFGDHLRSILLDSPLGTPALAGFNWDRDSARSQPRVIAADCGRSPLCSADHPDPPAELNDLIETIRAHPIEGDTHDASGNLIHVRVDETALLSFVIGDQTGFFTSTGEVLAAGAALEHGDAAPLLRLGAEGFYGLEGDYGDPTVSSAGAAAATCVDHVSLPWDWAVPLALRKVQFARNVANLPANFFAPFSKAAATAPTFSTDVFGCLSWEKPTPSSPVTPPHATYPRVPVLVLNGELDNLVPIESGNRVAALYPNSTSVTIAGVAHKPATWFSCAPALASEFVENLRLADTSCAKEAVVTWPAVGRFPVLAKDARPAEVDFNGGNQIGLAERKVVTVALATAIDALQRTSFSSGDGTGLRGGTFHADFGDTWTITLTDCVFAKDLTVNGSLTWQPFGSLTADLNVSGSGTAGGTLRIEGTFLGSGAVGRFKVSGVLGGRRVAALVPEA